ncbi:hypothetical protein ABB37_08196 [Leptomonas pyrrhocoris]|uniref:RING-type domain-containing protein n=1 Tax=Leptomonas pyrrhocoris TaxID=157538 RepID=A0A0N0DSJ1_LEPPY|nr:hypothetical protein ABB37_08196 [Leptomonas pyrrhocoris]KPA76064.1 hypothetical protein ABB37_08196 [Leptomonas pyrrhocoris]|eukprot:XP_015654503.1 hypothetical protein ABB37_08196 [Leptomonas pyrrhocoris]
MGNKPSQVTNYPVSEEELRHAPHNFYLVFGKPSIRFARDRMRGPLIYDVQVEYDADDDALERATTLDLSCAVPRRQKFQLISIAQQPPPPTPSTVGDGCSRSRSSGGGGGGGPSPPIATAQGTGLALTFRVAASAPPSRVRVLTGVSVEYRSGYGIHLASGDSSPAHPRCIYDTDATDGLDTVVTRAEVFPQHLLPVKFEEAPLVTSTITAERVTYAPLVIEVDVGETEDPMRNARQPASAQKTEARAEERAAHPSLAYSLPASPSIPSTPPPPSRKRILQYTLLELPEEAKEALSSTGETDAAPVRLSCRVCKQLLQVGSEVYDLEDVFDVGRDDEEAPNPLAVPDEDEDLCVVCLTNPKNTTILPCRHMCLCTECATHLRLSNNRCPMCRGNIDRLMTI